MQVPTKKNYAKIIVLNYAVSIKNTYVPNQ